MRENGPGVQDTGATSQDVPGSVQAGRTALALAAVLVGGAHCENIAVGTQRYRTAEAIPGGRTGCLDECLLHPGTPVPGEQIGRAGATGAVVGRLAIDPR